MRIPSIAAPLALAALLAGCAASIPPVEITRFHLNQPIASGTVRIEPLTRGGESLEFRTYAAAVGSAMARAGFASADGDAQPAYIAAIEVTRDVREALRKRSPVTIGIGGGTGGYGSGVGLGASFGIGGSRAPETAIVQLSVRLMKRSDRSVIWEGRAKTQAAANSPAAQPGLAAEKLADALFRDFPGESGRTITVQ